jgi:hypothetical protein
MQGAGRIQNQPGLDSLMGLKPQEADIEGLGRLHASHDEADMVDGHNVDLRHPGSSKEEIRCPAMIGLTRRSA